MKKKLTVGLMSFSLLLAVMACEKENFTASENKISPVGYSEQNQGDKTNQNRDKSGANGDFGNPSDGFWITPSGIAIPFSQRDRWQTYVDSMMIIIRAQKRGYTSHFCATAEIKCGLKCVRSKKEGDCVKESACAPCYNCGCTPRVE